MAVITPGSSNNQRPPSQGHRAPRSRSIENNIRIIYTKTKYIPNQRGSYTVYITPSAVNPSYPEPPTAPDLGYFLNAQRCRLPREFLELRDNRNANGFVSKEFDPSTFIEASRIRTASTGLVSSRPERTGYETLNRDLQDCFSINSFHQLIPSVLRSP